MTHLGPQSVPSIAIRFKAAETAAERAGAAALRHSVFVAEQRIFAENDRDAIDATALPLVALTETGEVVGAVRIHEEGPGLWWGSRLAVAPSHRRIGRLGAELIRLAVGAAQGRGCTRFTAHVQVQNAPLFRRLRWRATGELTLHGRPHLRMEADLAHYPPILDPATPRATLTAAPR